jgi:hypothetical protein
VQEQQQQLRWVYANWKQGKRIQILDLYSCSACVYLQNIFSTFFCLCACILRINASFSLLIVMCVYWWMKYCCNI